MEEEKFIPNGKESNNQEWLSPVEAAEYSGLSIPRMYQMIRDMVVVVKEIPKEEREHRGPTVMVLKDSIDTYLANRDKPREAVSKTTTKYIPAGPHIEVDSAELAAIMNVPLRELIAAYKERRLDKTVYTIREAARITGEQISFIQKACDLGWIDSICQGGKTHVTERGINNLKESLNRK